MMLYPSIDKIIEKNRSKIFISYFIKQRAHEYTTMNQLMKEHYESHKNVVVALGQLLLGT